MQHFQTLIFKHQMLHKVIQLIVRIFRVYKSRAVHMVFFVLLGEDGKIYIIVTQISVEYHAYNFIKTGL